MDKIPQELVERISSFLESWDLRATLTLNSRFQAAAERYCGRFNLFNLDRNNADKFLATFSGRRFQYLRRINYATTLFVNDLQPNHRWFAPREDTDWDLTTCRESKETLEQLDEAFTEQIEFLFNTLKTLEDRVGDAYGPGKIRLTILTPIMELDRHYHCRHHEYVSWRIHLQRSENLPKLSSVRQLRFQNGTGYAPFWDFPTLTLRKLDLRILMDIACKLPNLEHIACEIGGDDWCPTLADEVGSRLWLEHQGPRRDSRHHFSDSLDLRALPYLREVELNFLQPTYLLEQTDQHVRMPNLLSPLSFDPFSSSLRILSYQLRRMCLFAIIDGTLFFSNEDNAPMWPRLEVLHVKFHMASPSGKWYFMGLRNDHQFDGYELDERAYPPLETTHEDEEWCREAIDDRQWDDIADAKFRLIPDEEAVGPFLTAFARATEFMPALKNAALWCPLQFRVPWEDNLYEFYETYDTEKPPKGAIRSLAWGIAYTSPGEKWITPADESDSGCRQLWWMVGNQWSPSKELHEMLKGIGRSLHGDALVEHWDHRSYEYGLVKRSLFEKNQKALFPEFST